LKTDFESYWFMSDMLISVGISSLGTKKFMSSKL